MMQANQHDASDDLADFPPDEFLLVEDARLEVRVDARGQKRFRIAGMHMAWCRSINEARRVASILLRAAHQVPPAQGRLRQRLADSWYGRFTDNSIAV